MCVCVCVCVCVVVRHSGTTYAEPDMCFLYGNIVQCMLTVRAPERARARLKGRESRKEGEDEGTSRGIKPKPQDISDLEGKWGEL